MRITVKKRTIHCIKEKFHLFFLTFTRLFKINKLQRFDFTFVTLFLLVYILALKSDMYHGI